MLDDEPKSMVEALSGLDAPFWQEAINSEIELIMRNNIWVLVDLPEVCKTLGCKWILWRKYKTDGTIEKYKARLVVKDFKHQEEYARKYLAKKGRYAS